MRHVVALAVIVPALTLTASMASAAGTGKFCLQGPGTTMNCQYRTMASCDKGKKSGQTCVANASGTSGSGMNKPASSGPGKKY